MHRYTYALIIIALIILGGTIINNASAYVIDHNNHSVWITGDYGKLEATPHTITQSGWVYFNITPYQDIGNIDMVWGFNTSEVKPRKAEFFKPHWINWTVDHEKFFWNVSKIEFTIDDCCCGNEYNIYKRKVTYQTGYNNETNESIMTTETVCFDSYTHNGTNYTAYWTTHHSRLENWIDVSNKFHLVNYNYDNKTRWWYVTNFAVEKNKTYTGRVWIDVPISLHLISGKYDFAVKRSSDSLHDAISNHQFYLLDPWFNSSWSTKRNLHIHRNGTIELNNPTEDGYIYSSTYTRYNDSDDIYSYVYNVSKNEIYRGYVEWNISSIPDDAIITNVIFKYHGHGNHGDAHINQMICQPSISSNQDVYDDIGNGTTYINQDGFPEIGDNKEINLGSNAVADLQNASNWFAIGIQEDETIDGKYSTLYSEEYSDANPKPTLYVEYILNSETLNYYQMNLNLSYSDIPEVQQDFDDIRFVNISDGTSLPYWIEDKVDGSWCSVWVNITSLHAGWNNDTVALYYGNADATSASDIDATFVVGDDFEDGTVGNAPSGWVVTDGTPQIQNDYAKTGTKSLKFGITDADDIYKIFGTTTSKTLSVDFDFRTDATDTAKSWHGYEEGNSAYPYGPYSAAHNTGYFVSYYDGAYHNMETYNANQWYKHQMRYDASTDTFDWVIDSTAYTDIPFRNAKDNIDKILFTNYQSSVFWIDNFRVRKYTAILPTYVFGDAEQQQQQQQPLSPPTKPPFTEIDLIDQLHHEYTHIECKTMHIPIYIGLNYISIPLYQYNTSLAALFNDHPVDNDTMKKYINGTWNVSSYNNGTWINASDIEPIEPTVGYEYNRTGDNFTLNVSGYMKYNITIYTNYKNRVGTNIIRPMRSDKDD